MTPAIGEQNAEPIADAHQRGRQRRPGAFGWPAPFRRNDLAGILFVNNDGIEAGGLVYRGRKVNGKISAGGTPTIDQYNEDQVGIETRSVVK